jgi:hypothetical protein
MMKLKYWYLDEAVQELERRQSIGITRELEEAYNFFWLPKGKLYGFLGRHIASCRLEELQFFKRCVRSGLQPLWLEYLDDHFCTNNPSKIRLVKLRILLGRGKRGGVREKIVRAVDLSRASTSIRELRTWWGEHLYEFHHRVLNCILGAVQIVDMSHWFKQWGRASSYYEPYLALAIAHGVLFESFESPGFPDLERFKKNVVIPSYNRLVQRWGVEPIIVYHPVPPEMEAMYLNYYPPEILRFIPERR